MEMTNMNECLICTLSKETKYFIKVEGCNHMFCKSCLKTWVLKNPTCPFDRQMLINISIYSESEHTSIIKSIDEIIFQALLVTMTEDLEAHLKHIIHHIETIVETHSIVDSIYCTLEKYCNNDVKTNFQIMLNSNSTASNKFFQIFLTNMSAVSEYYPNNLTKLNEELELNSKDLLEKFNMFNESIDKHFPHDTVLDGKRHKFKQLLTIYKTLQTISDYFQVGENYFRLVKKNEKRNSFEKCAEKIILKNIYHEIKNRLKSKHVIENYISQVKSLLLKALPHKHQLNLSVIFEDSTKKCIICKEEQITIHLDSFIACNHKFCVRCEKMFDLSDAVCPFKDYNDPKMRTPNVDRIARNIESSYEIIIKRLILAILDSCNLVRDHSMNIIGKDKARFIQLSIKTFTTHYDDLVTITKDATHLLNIFSNLHRTYFHQFNDRVNEVLLKFYNVIIYLHNKVLTDFVYQIGELSESEDTILYRSISNDEHGSDDYYNLLMLKDTFVSNFNSLKPINSVMKQEISSISSNYGLQQNLKLVCDFEF